MRADGRDEDDGVVGMAEGAAGCEVVGCRARRRRHADTVSLHRCEVLVVAEDFDRGHGWIGTSVEHYFVEDVVRSLWSVGGVVVAFFADELFYEIFGLLVCDSSLAAHHCGFEA